MTGICFYFEDEDTDVWSGKGLDAWNYALKVAGDITDVIIINNTDQHLSSFDAALNSFKVVNTLIEAQELMTGDIQYVCTPWDNIPDITSITEFQHTNDWYVMGPASGWNNKGITAGLTMPQSGKGACHSVHIATALMFNRYWTLNL